MESPCKNCGDRFIGCHAICEKYTVWNNEHTKKLERIYAVKTKERLLDNYREDTFRKIRKSH